MLRQFVASAYIFDKERVLLIYHCKLQKWLSVGGHIDPNELPCEAAVREALEETGIEIELLSDEHVWVDCWNAKSIPRPFLCLLEEIPAHGDHPSHQHIDSIFIARPIGRKESANLREVADLKWFTLEEVEALVDDNEIFVETKKVLRSIFHYLSNEELCGKKLFSLQQQVSM